MEATIALINNKVKQTQNIPILQCSQYTFHSVKWNNINKTIYHKYCNCTVICSFTNFNQELFLQNIY